MSAGAPLAERVRRHYDRLTPLYRMLWGDHIHHGYWEGDETPARAQENLVRLLAAEAGIGRGARVLDVGCGVGGPARWLAGSLGCEVAGLTLSLVQASAAARLARPPDGRCGFLQADAARLPVREGRFDAVWIVECAEHLEDKPELLRRLAACLRPGGALALCGWFAGEVPASGAQREQLGAVLEGMLLPSLATIPETCGWIEAAGLAVTARRDITDRVARTWELCLRIARSPLARAVLPRLDEETRRFVASFEAMRDAYASGAMRYGLVAARLPR